MVFFTNRACVLSRVETDGAGGLEGKGGGEGGMWIVCAIVYALEVDQAQREGLIGLALGSRAEVRILV